MLGGLGVPTRVDARPPHSEGPAGAVAKRERFAHRPRWGANVRSRELQAAPWLTRGPGGAIRRGRVVTRDVARSCDGACGRRDSLFANRASWRPEAGSSKWAGGAPNSPTLGGGRRIGERDWSTWWPSSTGCVIGSDIRISRSLAESLDVRVRPRSSCTTSRAPPTAATGA